MNGKRILIPWVKSIALAPIAILMVAFADAGTPEPQMAKPTPSSELTVDDSFAPKIRTPAFSAGKGPRIAVDEHHRNVVSLSSYFGPVGRFLQRDGYRVTPWAQAFEPSALKGVRVLVIANAQAPAGAATEASAFTAEEVRTLERWVRDGGGLLLIADRAPFGGPAQKLANALGVKLDDNTVLIKGPDGKPTGELSLSAESEGDAAHPIFSGVLRLVYVVGESLSGPGVILRAPKGAYSGPTAQATDGPSAAGKPLALAFAHGKGRVVVIGDAGIASAFGSVNGAAHRGISEADNANFVRNVVRWLAR